MYSKGSNSAFVKKIAAINPTYPTPWSQIGWLKKLKANSDLSHLCSKLDLG